jgi:hypothetical protein
MPFTYQAGKTPLEDFALVDAVTTTNLSQWPEEAGAGGGSGALV